MNNAPAVKDVLLVGGGHSHVLFIRMWAMQPLPGVRLTLVSEKVDTPYSGMLPGLIAGHYSESDVHIDLARLCNWANVRFIEQRVSAIDLELKRVVLDSERPAILFDVLSLDTGSTPSLNVNGSEKFSVPVKPVHGFYQRWQAILARLQAHNEMSVKVQTKSVTVQSSATEVLSLGVVGSGAGGFELITAMRHALADDIAICHWFIRGKRALKGRPEKVGAMALQAAKDAGVVIHLDFDVTEVQQKAILSRDGRTIELDEIVWCAAAKAPAWPGVAGFSVDDAGFVLTNAHLQSISHDFVFATGDIGTQQATPSDKAGVFAVRQAPILFKNIRRYLLRQQLKTYRPQKNYLSLMATGKKSAIGNRGRLSVQGEWVWRLKDHIDQKFMNQFRVLPEMNPNSRTAFRVPKALLKQSSLTSEEAGNAVMRCRGCGGKVGASILDSVLKQLSSVVSIDVVSGLAEAADAAVINTNSHQLVQSVDQISSVCDDPYAFGRIATVHAVSDIVAAGATPHSAQVLVTLPFADHELVKRDLQQLMTGVVDALNADDCSLIGGHTSEGRDLSLGFVVNGFIESPSPEEISKVNPGDHLILTKPIGTGVLLAGMMRQRSRGSDVQYVLASMQQSNRAAAAILHDHGMGVVTDITGFGLLGHLQRLLAPLGVGAAIQVVKIPVYNGALALATSGIRSTLLKQNQQVLSQVSGAAAHSAAWQNLLCDPQTSGGLLGIVSASKSSAVLTQLRAAGCESACIIGSISDQPDIQLNS